MIKALFKRIKTLNNAQKALIVIAIILLIVLGHFSGLFNTDQTFLDGSSSGEDGTHAPYGILISPKADESIGYAERVTGLARFDIPIRIVFHDTDGDLRSYRADFKVSYDDWVTGTPDEYTLITSGSISGTVYDREVYTTINVYTKYSSLIHTSVWMKLAFKFFVSDFYGNDRIIDAERQFEFLLTEESDLDAPTTEGIEDNQDPLDDILYPSGTPSFEFLIVIPAIYLITVLSRRKED